MNILEVSHVRFTSVTCYFHISYLVLNDLIIEGSMVCTQNIRHVIKEYLDIHEGCGVVSGCAPTLAIFTNYMKNILEST